MKRSDGSIPVVLRLIRRELVATYAKVPGGVLWSYLEPVLTVGLLTFGFSLVLRTPPLGQSFALFFASGYGVFLVFQTVAGAVGHGFSHLKRKGRRHWPEAILARLILSSILGVSVALSLGFGAALATANLGFVDLWGLVLAMGLASLCGLTIGMTNCALFAIFPLWRPLWGIASRLLFLVSSVLFLPRDMPSGVQDLLAWNPILHVLSLLRQSLYHGYAPLYQDVFFVAFACLILTTFGLFLIATCHPVPRAARRRTSA